MGQIASMRQAVPFLKETTALCVNLAGRLVSTVAFTTNSRSIKMYPESHSRLIAILHIVHGFLAAASALGLFLTVIVLVGFKTAIERWVFPIGHSNGEVDPELWLGIIILILITLYVIGALLFTIPAIVGGYGMWRQKSWARKVVLLSAVVAMLNFPFGTAIGVYTFWFLLNPRAELKV